LDQLELEQRAEVVISGDTLSRAKPDPLPLLHACKIIGVKPSDTVFVGDDQRDVLAGQAAGIATVGVTWGYSRPDDAKSWGARWIASNAQQLIQILGI
jgi:phosphoglycolate phosphatase